MDVSVAEKISQLCSDVNAAKDKGPVEPEGVDSFPEDYFCETPALVLRSPSDSDKDAFLAVKAHYSSYKHTFNHDMLKNQLWDEHLSKEALYCSIIRKDISSYIGYCGIHNLHKDVWEIAIELSAENCGKGYGFEALSAFFAHTTELLGPHVYVSRVEVDNIASQKLMEKLGFRPFGISEYYLHDTAEMREVEEKYAARINARYIELADRFHTTPEKLLSHVLEYRMHAGR